MHVKIVRMSSCLEQADVGKSKDRVRYSQPDSAAHHLAVLAKLNSGGKIMCLCNYDPRNFADPSPGKRRRIRRILRTHLSGLSLEIASDRRKPFPSGSWRIWGQNEAWAGGGDSENLS